MKTFNKLIEEKLILNKTIKTNSDKTNSDINLNDADYICKSWKELNENSNKFLDKNTILPFIHAFIQKWPIYIWVVVENTKKADELDKKIKIHRETKHVNLDKSIPKSITNNNAISVVLIDDKTKYTEIFIISKNLPKKQMWYIIQE